MLSAPTISVVVTVVEGPNRLAGCLTALARQVDAPDFEVVVPVDSTFDAAIEPALASARIERTSGRRTPAELRALGVHQARGAIVALTEDHCTPSPDWCAEIARAHAAAHAVIGGTVEKEQPDGAVGWALYFADYVRYTSPDEGSAGELTDCNVSYKRSALMAIEEVWRDAFHEPLVHEAILGRGGVLWRSPRIRVRQRRGMSWRRAVGDRYRFGRIFGETRSIGRPTLVRLGYGAACVLLPPILLARSAGHVLRARHLMPAFVRSFPALVLLDAVWAWGELAGSVAGRPEAASRHAGSIGP